MRRALAELDALARKVVHAKRTSEACRNTLETMIGERRLLVAALSGG